MSLLILAVSISLLLTGPRQPSIEWNLLKREVFLKGKEMVFLLKETKNNYKDMKLMAYL
jgi:hypothetical protein